MPGLWSVYKNVLRCTYHGLVSVNRMYSSETRREITSPDALEEDLSARRIKEYVFLAVVLIVLYIMMLDSEWIGSVQLHSFMEGMATLLALIIGSMALVRYYTLKETVFLFIGAGFLGTAFLDGYHTFVTSAYFRPMMPSDLPSLIPWSWIASRMFLSIFMVLSWLAWVREERLGNTERINEWTVYLFTVLFTLASFLFFALVPLPRAYYPELFFGRPEDLIPAVFFAIALYGYLRKGHWKNNAFEHWLVLSLIIGVVGQTVFMVFSTSLFDFEFDAAHLLKKSSYVCVLTGLLVSMSTIFLDERIGAIALDAALKRSEIVLIELERMNQELDDFAYSASHDLKEPLRGIHNYSQFLIEDYSVQLGDEGRDKLETLKRLATRMDDLISALLNFSRVGRIALTLSPVNTGTLALSALDSLKAAIEESETEVSIAGDLPDLECDPVLVGQVFQNLIANAIKYSERRGQQVKVGWNGDTQVPTFHVSDDGIGIKEKDFESIFQIFNRLHSQSKFGGGLGAGLTIVKKIVERHGGRIWVKSKPGRGSTFYFTLSEG